MIYEKTIKDWWEQKITNYARRNKLTISQAKENVFYETHENFVEFVPYALKKFVDEKSGR